ncbi:hypothetical protein [Jannaschia ovalis]|uniref:Uncharacterized protein n=1 Tax=Jannaschia ovalis TaxID=3038773 RepID=A0ABY8LC71_9RHOB|nr:hypothetical protein [Jannaschia sp. GRR-S6-38]WGH78925.1 hypothetical protein P8627_01285 [Jannaschia sp. GRR-S6-38]
MSAMTNASHRSAASDGKPAPAARGRAADDADSARKKLKLGGMAAVLAAMPFALLLAIWLWSSGVIPLWLLIPIYGLAGAAITVFFVFLRR